MHTLCTCTLPSVPNTDDAIPGTHPSSHTFLTHPSSHTLCRHAPPTPAASFYDVLGVDVDATADDIKAAYRKKAKALHPDVNSSVSVGAVVSGC